MVMVAHPRQSPNDFHAGVTVVVYWNDPAFQQKTEVLLDHLAGIGVNSVSFTFPLYQSSYNSTDIHETSSTPTHDKIGFFTREARRRGFTVMLRPLLDDVSLQAQGYWRGIIAPSSVSAWFQSYTALLVQYGQIAQSENAQVIDIGTEFKSLEPDTSYWLGLIQAIRQVYSGQLTYSANWDDRNYPAFGTALDLIGIDAFYPLAVPVTATPDQIAAAWAPGLARTRQLARAMGKPVLYTEIGTTSEVGSFQVPWSWKHGTGVSQDAQRVYYAGSCQAVKGQVAGMYWWQVNLEPLPAPASDIGFNPEGKQAEAEITHCYQ